ncbi:MAG: endonuclease [Achromobacter sp.]|uniref:endonuclease n=1 Tax=Achromobacter sp. TaxID=134375 RepID=UPI0012C7AF36|nr:endonuclease [Achromobacter sp.]MPS81654.1 endonuclease [Achromobacter sp.]
MDLSAYLVELLKAPNLPAMSAAAQSLPPPVGSRAEAKLLYGRLRGYIAENDRRCAVASTLTLLRHNGPEWLARMRKDGLFRASRYGYDGSCVKKIVEAARELSAAASLPPGQIQYLESLQALLELAKPARQIHQSIVLRLKLRKRTALKTLLTLVNSMFSAGLAGEQAGASQPLLGAATYLASAYSRLYMISRDELGIDPRTWTWTDDLAVSPHERIYKSLLEDALRLNKLIDAEVLLDGLPYKAEVTQEGVLVSAIDPEFERSVRLGYIQVDTQLLHRGALYLRLAKRLPQLRSFMDALSPHFDDDLLDHVSLTEEPLERLEITFPNTPALIELLNFDGPFLEELPLLDGARIDNFQPSDIAFLQVSDHLSNMDVLKAQRLFKLIDAMIRKKLETWHDAVKARVLALRSTVMVIPRAELQAMLELVLSPDQTQELILLLSLPTTSSTVGSDAYIDLQYRPFVHSLSSSGDLIAIPPAIVGTSNLVRSIMQTSGIRRATEASNDPMQVAIAGALREAGFLVQENFEFNMNGKRETDIFCYRDGVLFVIECKNAYHPCSPHELRNSYDLMLKAEDQLNGRAQWLEETSHQERLFKALSWEVTAPAQVRTCIVTANRAFSGYRCGTHPVRQAHEMINVLVRGNVARLPDGPRRRFWRADAFQVADLVDYLDGESLLRTQHEAMRPTKAGINLNEHRLEFAQYEMGLADLGRLTEEFDEVHASETLGGAAEVSEDATH